MHVPQKITHAAKALLLLPVLAAPFAAAAGLASWDLVGATRVAPTTIGALEAIHLPTKNGGDVSVLGLVLRNIPAEKSYSAPLARTSRPWRRSSRWSAC